MKDEVKNTLGNQAGHTYFDFKVLVVSDAKYPNSSLVYALIKVFDICLIQPDQNQTETKLANWQPDCVIMDMNYVSEMFANKLILDARNVGIKVFALDTEEGVFHQLKKANAALEVECISKFMVISDVINRLSTIAASTSGGNCQEKSTEQTQMLEVIYHQVAGELHDELGSLLSSMKLKLDSVRRTVDIDDFRKELLLKQLNEIDQTIFDAIASVKNICVRHRQPTFELDLLAKFDKLISMLDIAVYKQVTSHAIRLIDKMDKDTLFQVYRIIQEALNNVQYHSKATEASVKFYSHQSTLLIDIIDQGIGFNSDQVAKKNPSFGLQSMHERASKINANLSVNSAPSEGVHVKLAVPTKH